jgi:hypothetical protein
LARIDASTTIPVDRQVLHRLVKTDAATAACGDASEHLVHGWALSKAAKLAGQVLLQRLPVPACAGLQPYVDVLWHISNQHVKSPCQLPHPAQPVRSISSEPSARRPAAQPPTSQAHGAEHPMAA